MENEINWFTDLETALRTASREGKGVLMEFKKED